MTPLGVNMKEAGELYGVSRWVVQDWIRAGLPYIPSGRKHKMILVSELAKWMQSRQISLGRKS